jgi:polysaccharide biosynthesis protein PslJ
MEYVAQPRTSRSVVPAVFVTAAITLLAITVVVGVFEIVAAGLLALVTLVAARRSAHVSWKPLLGGLILIILFIPIRRYALPGALPFELEPYRLMVALLLLGWGASLLVDPRVVLRRTGFEGPLVLVVGSVLASLVANPDRVAQFSPFVNKKVMFFLSFVLVLYLTVSVIRRFETVDTLVKVLVGGGAVVGLLAMVEARTGFNLFNHLDRAIPVLQVVGSGEPEAFQKYGAARLRVFASAQHPIALSAMFAILVPLSIYLWNRSRQRRWLACVAFLIAGCSATVSRTGVVMLIVVGLVFLWLRPRETRRLWPAIIPALIVIKLILPGTLGAIKQSFLPAGGLIAEQQALPGESGSGRLADLGPGLQEWQRQPMLGQGFGTRVSDENLRGPKANILDNQWLGTLLETGALGFFGWLWFFVRVVRRFGKAAKEDESASGWLLASLAASVSAFAVGMFTYDALAFTQVSFLLFILVGLGSVLLAERPAGVRARPTRRRHWILHPVTVDGPSGR